MKFEIHLITSMCKAEYRSVKIAIAAISDSVYIYRGEERASGWDPPVSFREWWPARRRLVMGPTAQ